MAGAQAPAALLAPVAAPPEQAPALDPGALRTMIREELQAEKAKAREQPGGKQPDRGSGDGSKGRDDGAEGTKQTREPEWIEVGKNLGLSATWTNGFVAETADKSFRIHIGGRAEFDNTWFTQDDNLLIGPSPDQRMQDGTLFRRARFRADGRLWEFIEFAAEVNFANIQDVSNVDSDLVQLGSVGLTDFWLTFREVPLLGNVRAGHVKAPVGLERYSSTNAWYYMEPSSLFDAFLNPVNYQNGVVLFDSYLDDRVTLAGCLAWVSKSTVQSFGFGTDENSSYGASCRVTALPVYESDGRLLMHVGAGYQHVGLPGHSFAAASRPLLRAGAGNTQTPNLLATGTFFTPNGVDLVDFEWAAVCGPFAISAEYAVARVTDVFSSFDGATFSGPRGNVTYQAAYVEAGYFLTPGDYRRDDRKTGTWARTVPQENAFVAHSEDGSVCSGHGAVQVVARYTFLDLVSGSPTLTPASGGARAGRQHDVTLGVNWYINPQVRVMLNYVWTHLDSVVPGASGNLQGVGCRLHIDF
jgi:phosphate-selective porin OprO/OprP